MLWLTFPRLVVICLLALLSASAAYSQTTFATITGTVQDATGAVVPKATVTATNTETNIKTSTTPNEAGNYTLAQLREGTYEVKVEAPGFQEFLAQNVALVSRDVRRLDITLQVGAVGTRVEVASGLAGDEAVILNPTDAIAEGTKVRIATTGPQS